MERVQIDFIDMRHSPDGEFNWIGHFTDHMSKFHILFPCKNKSAPEVAKLIEERDHRQPTFPQTCCAMLLFEMPLPEQCQLGRPVPI